MAGANLPAKKYTKTSPTVTRLAFESTGSATKFIDIGLALSKINRRFARSGVYYYVNSVEVYNNESGVVDLHTLPDTYMTKNAWTYAFKQFQKMNSFVDTPRPKWHDFRVYMSNLHRTTGSMNPIATGINFDTIEVDSNETFEYSSLTSADSDGDTTTDSQGNIILEQEADNFTVHMVGPHIGTPKNWSSVGAIVSYNTVREQVSMAGTPITHVNNSTDPLMNMFDFSSEEFLNDVASNLASANDMPPYPATYLLGEQDNHMYQVARIGTETGINRIGRAAGFCAPLGLICVDPSDFSGDYRIVLNLAVGTYHGVYAERA
jgi:hypothetical protein